MAEPNPWAKLDRAEEHFTELGELTADFVRPENGPTHTFAQATWDMPDGTWEVIYCDAVLRSPPLHWGLIAGDAIHNVRSALDHLAGGLVLANGGAITNRTQFPIYDHEPDKGETKRIQGNLAGMADDDADLIWEMQPYRDMGSERSKHLIALARLDNDDKHQVVHPVFARSESILVAVDPPDAGPPGPFLQYAPVVVGTPLLRWPSDSPIKGVTPQFGFTIGFGDEPRTLTDLRQLRDTVRDIAQSFPRLRPGS